MAHFHERNGQFPDLDRRTTHEIVLQTTHFGWHTFINHKGSCKYLHASPFPWLTFKWKTHINISKQIRISSLIYVIQEKSHLYYLCSYCISRFAESLACLFFPFWFSHLHISNCPFLITLFVRWLFTKLLSKSSNAKKFRFKRRFEIKRILIGQSDVSGFVFLVGILGLLPKFFFDWQSVVLFARTRPSGLRQKVRIYVPVMRRDGKDIFSIVW